MLKLDKVKTFVFGLGSLFFFLLTSSTASAQENWVIKNFESDITIDSSGLVKVAETIEVDFGNLQKHGIFREIPYVYRSDDGSPLYTNIEVASVEAGGSSVPYLVQSEGDWINIRIGDEDKTISGLQNYTIRYEVKGVLQSFSDYDELFWNVTGNYWEVPIEKASATVSLPSDGIVQVACYQGVVGSTESCSGNEIDKKVASFEATRSLTSNEGLTVAVGFTKGLVSILVGEKPETIWDTLFTLANFAIFFLVLILGIGAVVWLWLKKGRDFWWRSRFIHDPLAKAEVKPVGGHETVVVEFESPDQLRPAEIGALLDEKADTLDVTATLVDLANRGYLTIAEEPKKWLFGSTDYVLTQKNPDRAGLLDYEKELLERLFESGDIVSVSSLKKKFYTDLAKVKEKLYQDMVDKKFFTENPSTVRTYYSLGALGLGIVAGILIWIGFSAVLATLVAAAGAIVVVALFLLIMAQFMPARTAVGRQLYVRAKGYRMFVERAEKYRQQFFEKKNLFNEVLPYAIVFGVTEKFAKAFAEMGLKPDQPGWYTGSAPFNAAVFGASMASFSSSVSQAIASTPSGSGSGGGGSSGGGFGGGGGGSW